MQKQLKAKESNWNKDPFRQLYLEAEERTNQVFGKQAGGSIAVGKYKGYILTCLAMHASHFAGDIAEFGVYRGGSAYLIAKTVPQKNLYLFDTFTGIPEVDSEHDPKGLKGMFRGSSAQKVEKLLDGYNVHVYEGFFPDTTSAVKDKKFCFVHSDADTYSSTLASCKFFYPRLTPGGILVFDDYGFIGTPGARDAVDEFFEDKPEVPLVFMPDQAVIIKL